MSKDQAKLGKTLALLRTLPDFHLFRFETITGSYIRGFGQAWTLRGNELALQAVSPAD